MTITPLLLTCIGLGKEAADVIRSVQRDRESKGGETLKAELKDESDSTTWLTIADTKAQKVIVDGLRVRHPKVKIVAEEELTDPPSPSTKPTEIDDKLLPPEAATKINSVENLKGFKDEDYCVFIDPVDGTREFVEGRIDACQVLIGIARNGVPVAGVVVLPFWNGLEPTQSSTATGHIIFGVVGAGVFGLPPNLPALTRPNVVLATSALSSNPILSAAKETIHKTLPTCTDLPVGACGNKVLQMLLGKADLALFNLGTSLWDTCATGALVKAAGGEMSTLLGTPIQHHETSSTKNVFGVWVSMLPRYNASNPTSEVTATHSDISNKIGCRSDAGLALLSKHCSYHDPENRPPALDLLRGCSGEMITASWLAAMIENPSITHFCVPDADAVRYRQSYACRYYFYSKDEATGDFSLVQTAFYKWIVLNELPAAIYKAVHQPFKLVRDAKSCLVESDFYSSECCTEYSKTSGTQIALPYYTERHYVKDNPVDSRFYVMLKDFNQSAGWVQAPHFTPQQMDKSLESMAFFHAYFWHSRDLPHLNEFRSKMWDRAGYLEPAKQPSGQKEKLPEKWDEVMNKFSAEIATLSDEIPMEELKGIGKRLSDVVDYCSSQVHGITCDGSPAPNLADTFFSKYQTMVHGDAKAANFFFSKSGDELLLGLIDFQWVGAGTPSHDVAYCITASLSGDVTEHPKTLEPLVSQYYNSFVKALGSYGITSPPFSLAEFQLQCAVALLDISRVVVAEMLPLLSPDILKQRANKQSFNSYNKSADCLIWMVRQIHTSLKMVDDHKKNN